MPMRGVCTTAPDGAATVSSTRPAPISSPSSAGPTASAWPSRPGPRQRSSTCLAPAPLAHLLEARRRLERADQDGLAVALLRAADDVEHPVQAVVEVDVDPAGGPEHDRVARRRPGKRVRCRVVAPVGLALDDAPADAVDQQLAADQVVRDLEAACARTSGRCRSRRSRPARASARGGRPRSARSSRPRARSRARGRTGAPCAAARSRRRAWSRAARRSRRSGR